MSGCDCNATLNEHLAEHNSVLVVTLFAQRPLIETAKIDTKKRGKPRSVIASFCPFCGAKYPEHDGKVM